MNLKMKVILLISILFSLFAINSGHAILPGLRGDYTGVCEVCLRKKNLCLWPESNLCVKKYKK